MSVTNLPPAYPAGSGAALRVAPRTTPTSGMRPAFRLRMPGHSRNVPPVVAMAVADDPHEIGKWTASGPSSPEKPGGVLPQADTWPDRVPSAVVDHDLPASAGAVLIGTPVGELRDLVAHLRLSPDLANARAIIGEIGRASCRERV